MTERPEHPSWERMEGETAKGFACFEMYRNLLPVERKLAKVVQMLGRRRGYIRQVEKWSGNFHWVHRAQDYDSHIASVREATRTKAVIEMADRQARQGMILQGAGLRVFIDEHGNLRPLIGDMLTPHVAIRAMEVGAKMERLGRGEPTDNLRIVRKKPEEYTDEELDTLIDKIKKERG